MNITFYTLGCKVNQYETQSMREAFAAKGFNIVPENGVFDVAVINSCTVTAESDRKTRQVVRRFRRENPNAVIVLTGCMVQAFSQEAKELTEADVVVGNTDVGKIVLLVEKFLQEGEKIFCVERHERKETFNTPEISRFDERTRAYMKIEDGCDRYCSYCIIPYARGFVRSKAVEEIRREAVELAGNGYIEAVLVGINLSAYGKDNGLNLCDAVEAVCSVEGIKRVRLGSLEPDHISDDMLIRLKNQEKFCPQFHLSLQSGCDSTLKRMNRHYDTAFYRDLVKRIRKMFPTAALTTDIMVGFAGETDEEFGQSIAFLKEIGFAKTHVFAYSRRKGTVAYGLPNQVSKAEKAKRSNLMINAAADSEAEFLEGQIGKETEVLFETYENGIAFGFTPNYSRVAVQTDKSINGEIRTVRIISAEKDICKGALLNT